MNQLLLGIAFFIAAGLVTVPLQHRMKGVVFALFAAVAQFLILPPVFDILQGGPALEQVWHFSGPIGNASLRLDALSAFFILIISIGGLLAGVYSIGYMKMYQGNERFSLSAYYFFMGLLVASMLMVVIVQNVLLFLIVWETMSLASFFLVSFESRKEDVRKAGLYYLVSMQIGAAALIAAFAWCAVLTNSMDFNNFRNLSILNPLAATAIFILLFTGFGTKAGFMPLHTWLPLAHPAAPTGVSALMSGVMIKTGIYGILRMILIFGIPSDWLAYLIFGISLVTGSLGIMNAIAQRDIKRLLAFSSIENIGIIGMGIGLGMLGMISGENLIIVAGFLGALLHVFNHFTFKSLLFYGAGVVYSKTHTRDLDKLGGLVHVMPYTAGLFLIGSLAISGLPMLNGFISEFAIYFGLVKSLAVSNVTLNLVTAIGLGCLAFIGVMAMLCFTKVFGICFLGVPRNDLQQKPQEAPATMLIPMFVLAFFIVLIGLFSPKIIPLLSTVVGQFSNSSDLSYWNEIMGIFFAINFALLIFFALILFFWGIRWFLLSRKKIEIFKTWDCGFQNQSSRMQYTASSFVASFLGLVKEFVPQRKQFIRPQGLFPENAHFESHNIDLVNLWLIGSLIELVRRFLGLFSWIQSGRTQQYILYGLIFLIILVIWVIGVR